MDDPYKAADGNNYSDHQRTQQDVHFFVLFTLRFYFAGGFLVFFYRIVYLRP
jgi:hypothetical protein